MVAGSLVAPATVQTDRPHLATPLDRVLQLFLGVVDDPATRPQKPQQPGTRRTA